MFCLRHLFSYNYHLHYIQYSYSLNLIVHGHGKSFGERLYRMVYIKISRSLATENYKVINNVYRIYRKKLTTLLTKIPYSFEKVA